MKRILLVLILVLSFQENLPAEGGVVESLGQEVPIYSFVHSVTSRFPGPAEEKHSVQQAFVRIDWTRFDFDPGDLSPPKLVRGGIYQLQPQVPAPGSRGRNSSVRRFLANIDQQGDFWKSFELAYRVARDQTENITKIGRIEVNYFVDRPTSYFSPDQYDAASIAIHLMALFRREWINDRSILLGTLEPGGRIGPGFSMISEKVLLMRHAHQILIPTGQLTVLDPTVIDQLQQHGTKVLEVETLEEAYQLMVRAR